MQILLTGANGYIGMRLLPILLAAGHRVICAVRDRNRFEIPENAEGQVEVIELDLLNRPNPCPFSGEIDAAYYLIHSMSGSSNYQEMEKRCAENFNHLLKDCNVEQVIYLSGMANAEELSEHLASRLQVERILSEGDFHLTTLRAGIIIGSGSASFEIIRDLVEKLPVMIAPRWLNTLCQPIGVRNVLEFLAKVLHQPSVYDQDFDIGGPDILTYKQMLLQFAEVRKLKRYIFTVPVMTPKLSSYWLYFVTSTSYKLAQALVSSMRVNVVCRNQRINELLNVQPMSYREALEAALVRIQNNYIESSWKDSFISSPIDSEQYKQIRIPKFGCLRDRRKTLCENPELALEKIWSIGGENGWYYGDWLWKIRGYLDKLIGGVGLRRGRTHNTEIATGDALDFWRVLYANKSERRLVLFAEMILPGEAWLEFKIDKNDVLHQTATFRPHGITGRLYWYVLVPFHHFIFQGMMDRIANTSFKTVLQKELEIDSAQD